MKSYERLAGVLDRQQKYRVLDTVVALVLVLGLAVTAFAVIMQMPASTAGIEALDAPAVVDATTYTAQLLADSAADLQ